MRVYRVKDWDTRFENNRTRELKKLDWVPTPNKHDGDGYTLLLSMKNGEALFGAWNAILQVASRCEIRGTLLRSSRTPHDSASLSRITRFSTKTIDEALIACSSVEVGWLEFEEIPENGEIPHPPAVKSHLNAEIPQEGATEGKEGKGMKEGNIFKKPPIELVEARCLEIGLPTEEAQAFIDHHEARGWVMSNGKKMACWKAALNTWKRNWVKFGAKSKPSRMTHMP